MKREGRFQITIIFSTTYFDANLSLSTIVWSFLWSQAWSSVAMFCSRWENNSGFCCNTSKPSLERTTQSHFWSTVSNRATPILRITFDIQIMIRNTMYPITEDNKILIAENKFNCHLPDLAWTFPISLIFISPRQIIDFIFIHSFYMSIRPMNVLYFALN